VPYWCVNGHEVRPSFAVDAELPETWDCPRCGLPAGRDRETPPAAPRNEPYKTHLAYVKERRSDADGAAILEEALARLREKRGG
jgi:RNA polymerase-binding protein